MGLTVLAVPEPVLRAPGRFDMTGALGLSAGLVLLLLPITKGSDWGWTSPTTLGLVAAGLVVLLLWGMFELRSDAPLVDLRTTARREVLLTNLASIMVGVAFYAVSLVLPQLLQLPLSTGYGLGQSMVVAGLCVAPLGLTMMLVAPLYARLSARYGPKVSLMLGMAVIAIGYGAGLGLMSAAWQTVVIAVVLGAGIGLAYSSLPALIIGAVDASETGAATGLNTLMRSIGTSVSSAVIGMVLAHTSTQMGSVAVPTMQGFRTSFMIATGAVLAGLVLAAFLPSQRAAAAPVLLASSAGDETARLSGLPLPLPGSGFRGRVTDADGTPVAGANVTLIDRQGRQAGLTTTDAEGRYALAAPAGGSFVLAGSAAGYAPRAYPAAHPASGRPAETDLVLTLSAPARRTSVPS